jgi:hypothetical protein
MNPSLIQSPEQTFIAPLFWQHGESETILRNEIRQMHNQGIGGFIVESRPHPDFLGERWWHDLDVIMDQARELSMKVWIFDDSSYPSGFSAGRIRDTHPEFLKTYLAEHHIDAIGPLSGSSFFIQAWLETGESLVRVIAAKRTDHVDRLDATTLIDLTAKISNGILYWDVPEGDWRLFILICTRNGGEDWTRDYLNPLLPQAVQAYLDFVYEAHYQHYAVDFGKTLAGFFSDEPRFGNAASYEATIGKHKMVLPYAPNLLSDLNLAWGGEYSLYLPCLWYEGGTQTARVRYTYMDVVSRAFGNHFSQQIGDWCQAHGVQLIGHIVEDNGAHARLGYGPGHFFRAISGQHTSGLDIVYQVWPEFNTGRFTTPFGYLEADFFYWGITKMASSAGHIDPRKNGVTVCEVFGAYGWQEGLKLMKWLTDHICVRGVNFIIPHAFSPKAKDPDCPPHFYARGLNPQWRYFGIWSSYANRLCALLSGGNHIAPVAVLYHAEAEWCGEYEPFEKVVKTLALQQIDCDILPADTLIYPDEIHLEPRGFRVNRETYQALIIPFAEKLPGKLLRALNDLAVRGVQVIFMNGIPNLLESASNQGDEGLAHLEQSNTVKVHSHAELVPYLHKLELREIESSSQQPDLRYYHYHKQGADLYFFTNESRSQALSTTVTMRHRGIPIAYDAIADHYYQLDTTPWQDGIRISLDLEPYESLFIIFYETHPVDPATLDKRLRCSDLQHTKVLNGDWQVSLSAAQENLSFHPEARLKGPGNVALPDLLPDFSGTIRYQTTFERNGLPEDPGQVILDLGSLYETAEVQLNGRLVGVRICPPYIFNITPFLEAGNNHLQVDVTNTLAKQYGGQNSFDRAMAQEPSGLVGPVQILCEFQRNP